MVKTASKWSGVDGVALVHRQESRQISFKRIEITSDTRSSGPPSQGHPNKINLYDKLKFLFQRIISPAGKNYHQNSMVSFVYMNCIRMHFRDSLCMGSFRLIYTRYMLYVGQKSVHGGLREWHNTFSFLFSNYWI